MSAKPLRLLSWNVNGIRAAQRKGFIDWLGRERPDILCVQETKASPDQLDADLTRPTGYGVDWDWPKIKKGYSGVATFSKENPGECRRGLGVQEFDDEGRTLVSIYPDFVLFNIYFPNGKKDAARLDFKMGFYAAVLKTIERFRKKGLDKIVICGDVNTAHKDVDLARPKENRKISGFLPHECAWIDALLASGFVDTFREFKTDGGHYTWWDTLTRARERNVGWRIDYFFISENLRPRLKNAFILPEVMGSDHCPVGIELSR
ncbi:MAG: exodeoxyribonuclease III [Elusimicrobiota bacterium]